MRKLTTSGINLILVCALFMPIGCTINTKDEGFAIYLTKDDIHPAQMEAMSHVKLADQPVVSMKDVITYNAQTHEIKLTASAFERIYGLDVPVRGKSFMVCVDKKPIYWGAFWTPISSISFDGVTIWIPLGFQEPNVITLELGYPSSTFYAGEDPRNNPEILNSLREAGKLINELSISDVNKLPHSVKGYELYSWSEDGTWRFTLITGTNRNKTLDEIVAGENVISESGWVNVRMTGLEATKEVLSKLPQEEFVIWIDVLREQTEQTDIKIQLPPGQTVNDIKEYTLQCGLDLHIEEP
ncbi:MAG: hypothetical protein A2Z74_03550 [Chloroflexi bacterium RBG_13_46_9]|nr:MAG: hypothetical protein A2Z74_03550 [Chloroflexi bacterium RBG_13_46_9]